MVQVETFECQETAAEPIEASEEAIGIIEKLGLEGQRQLVSRTESGFETRCPYRKITAEEYFAYRTLCPKRTPLGKYSDGPIPLRVLQIASHAAELKIGPHFEVWHRAIPEVKDPVLVATADNDVYEWTDRNNDKIFILARWGEELEPLQVLLRRAKDVAIERLSAEASSVAGRVQSLGIGELVKLGHRCQVQLS